LASSSLVSLFLSLPLLGRENNTKIGHHKIIFLRISSRHFLARVDDHHHPLAAAAAVALSQHLIIHSSPARMREREKKFI
jgi:hypothetical protein